MNIDQIPDFIMALEKEKRWESTLDFCQLSLNILRKYFKFPWRKSYREDSTYSKVKIDTLMPENVFSLKYQCEAITAEDLEILERDMFYIVSDIDNDVMSFKNLEAKYAYLTCWNLLLLYKDIDNKEQLKIVLKLMLSTLVPHEFMLSSKESELQQFVDDWYSKWVVN